MFQQEDHIISLILCQEPEKEIQISNLNKFAYESVLETDTENCPWTVLRVAIDHIWPAGWGSNTPGQEECSILEIYPTECSFQNITYTILSESIWEIYLYMFSH